MNTITDGFTPGDENNKCFIGVGIGVEKVLESNFDTDPDSDPDPDENGPGK